MTTVAVGLSGGVDSTLTALLLKEKGYRVIGLSMSVYNPDIPNMVLSEKSCYGPTEKKDIRTIQDWAKQNGIDSHIIDLSDSFKKVVLQNFRDTYLRGATPNPCILCNQAMKFGLLTKVAREQGIHFDLFATGHFVRKEQTQAGFILKKGTDTIKDQSYFLYRLNQSQLSDTLFPLGDYTKEDVRQMARDRGLSVAEKADSQDFYGGSYTDLLNQPPKQGDIVLTDGHVLGGHTGFWNYTVGQRKGLGIAYPEPLYVIALDAVQNRVIVGPARDTLTDTCKITDTVWGVAAPYPEKETPVLAKYRSTGRAVPAVIQARQDTIHIRFADPQKALTKGQSVVFYQDDIVLGGGIIA